MRPGSKTTWEPLVYPSRKAISPSQTEARILAPEPNSAGGPYATEEGQDIRLEGFCLGCTSYAWDFDGDGVFDDATGNNQFSAAN